VKLRKLIRTLLKEYLHSDVVSLKRYFSMTEEERKKYLPYDYTYMFEDFLIEAGIELQKPKQMVASNYDDEPDEEVDMFEDNEYGHMQWVEKNHPDIFKQFADYLYDRLDNHAMPGLHSSEYPTWTYFSYEGIIKNQWLIHFTDNAEGISKEGFKYGVDDMDRLGLTTNVSEFEKKYGGYNFAYLLKDFQRYGYKGYDNYKYGKEAVVFNASGVKLWHHGDEEPQVIFYGNTATNIIAITKSSEDGNWTIYSKITGQKLVSLEKLEAVVIWISQHFNQYRRHLVK